MLQKTTVKPVNIVLILCVLKCAQISISTVLNVKPFLREVFRKKKGISIFASCRSFYLCFKNSFKNCIVAKNNIL